MLCSKIPRPQKSTLFPYTTLFRSDALTGLHNRRYFHETLGREVARAQRYRRELALIVIDLDNFKGVNEQIGHLRSEEHTSELQSQSNLVCRLLLEKKKTNPRSSKY